MDYRTEILSLREAIEVLKEMPGQLVETDVEVDPAAEYGEFRPQISKCCLCNGWDTY